MMLSLLFGFDTLRLGVGGRSVEIREKKTVALDTYWCPLHAQFRNTTYFVDKKALFLDLSVPEVEGNCHGWQLEESLARTTSG
jgi:hypothetical protein